MEDKIIWTPKTADKCAVKFFEKRTHTQEEISEVLSALEFLVNEDQSKNAALTLGSMFYTGDIVKQDFNEAKKFYTIAADLGSSQGLVNLGYIYYYARCGGEPDYESAFHCFSKASIIDDEDDCSAEAIYKLSDMYFKGLFVKQDKEYAKKIVYPLLFSENAKAGNYEKNVLGDVLVRLSTFESEDNAIEYSPWMHWKFTALAKQAILERYDGTWWGDKNILDKLESSLGCIEKTDLGSKILNSSISNPLSDNIEDIMKTINLIECDSYPISVEKSKNGKDILLTVECFNEFGSIPEINYADRIEVYKLVITNATASFIGTIRLGEGRLYFELEKNKLRLMAKEETICEFVINPKDSKAKFAQIISVDAKTREDLIITVSDEYKDEYWERELNDLDA